ncbi:MAG TPA: polyphosphate kinase 1 [Candidatus Binatia bacterium]|nr:polyphosphate kinase 1 [Candidatus Binatia bacterium]
MSMQNLKDLWLDRDLAWLEFNRRVLAEALDKRTPLLERIKFLAIFTSNLDEFFMKRVATLRVENNGTHTKLLADLRAVIVDLVQQQQVCFAGLLPQLEQYGIRLLNWKDLTDRQRLEATHFFQQNVLPALTPLVVDSAHPTPFLSNLSLSWMCRLQEPGSDVPLYGRVKVATGLSPWIQVRKDSPADSRWFISLTELVRQHLGDLFSGLETYDQTLFRITRDAEVEWDGDSSESVREVVAERIRLRRYEPAVRIEFGPNPDPALREMLLSLLDLTEQEAYDLPGPFDFNALWTLAGLDVPELRDPPWTPRVPVALRNQHIPLVNVIQQGDMLVHVPYESFDASVERFIREGATDPSTLGIKMTVYRVGDDTPFVRWLVMAAESGKQVACVIELKARFDENRNLHWADALLKVGAHVSFGVLELKIHAKLALVVRRESDGLRCYCHIGTGNYNQKTARLYEDLGLFTCDPVITGDVVQLFHYLTGRALTPKFERLLVAPWNMRDRFIELIRREVEHYKAGRPARIVAKMNQLEDAQVCAALVSASREGLPIDLVVRGFCCLRPGVPGQTETIRVRSIIGRFLEHSRIFYFANGASDPRNGDFYIGSGDWMERNLSWRVEVVVPVLAPALRQRLWEILDVNLNDCRQAWVMTASGDYRRLEAAPEASGVAADGTQATLIRLAAELAGNGSAVREVPLSLGPGLSFAHPEGNPAIADTMLENKRT